MSDNCIIEVNGLTVAYPDGRLALDGVSFGVQAAESVALLGANGAGKSSLLTSLVGILRGRGSITIDGIPLRDDTLPDIRRVAQLVFQDPDDQLFMPVLKDDVAFGPLNYGVPPKEVEPLVQRMLSLVGLEGFEDRNPHAMSLGERKRAALAATLACSPRVLLLDEVNAGLDPRGKRKLASLISSLKCTTIIATHDLDFARMICSRALVLQKGRIAADGCIESITSNESILDSCGLI